MKEKLIQDILNQIPINQNTILSEWSYLDGIGGYLVRKDGEIFTIGDDEAQALPSESYSHLNNLNSKELSKIVSHLIQDSDLLNDIKISPDFFPYSNIPKILAWASMSNTKEFKI